MIQKKMFDPSNMTEQQQLDAAMNANIEANNEQLTEDKMMQIAINQSQSELRLFA